MILILDNIRSMHNVGSLFRTADAAGVRKIYLCGITPTPTDRLGRSREQFVKVSLGAEKTIPWEYAARTTDAIRKVKRAGAQVIAVEQAPGSRNYAAFKPTDKKEPAIILGNEVDGVSAAALKASDVILEIPMSGEKESLNVAVTGGIILFHFRDCER
ncbi:MAG: TrmH family RNA methyltransferase [Patescibacteria group bacterium]|nr:TrmH family RNA methyltransferase [Patescibacteria group bacterium]